MSYVSGFLIAVPTDRKEDYRKMAADAAGIFKSYGAMEIMEAWGEDVRDGKVTDFRRAVQVKEGETVVFSWIVWPDRATADAAEKRMQEDDSMTMPDDAPFDGKRMVFGGFAPIFEMGRGGTVMSNRNGTPIWYELMTDAPDAAQEFYGAVMGWAFQKSPGGMERDYRTFAADGEGVGGVMKAPDNASFAPIWTVYFGVGDVDAAAEKVRSLGGSVHMEPQDIPGVGRFAFVADPQGAMFYLIRGDSERQSTAFAPMKAGHCSWNELVTSDQRAALEFYGKLFGWKKTDSMPMGEMGDYTFIGQSDADMIGAMMDAPETGNTPFWNFAFTVPDIDVAKAAVEGGGGTVTHGPVELPGDQGDWLIHADDPQGAKVMFTGKRKAGVA